MIISVNVAIDYTKRDADPEDMDQRSYMTFLLNPIKCGLMEDGKLCPTELRQYIWELVDPFGLYDDVTVEWKYEGMLTP